MSSIRAHAEHLATLDARFRPLATRLCKLAQGFQSVAIVDLLTTLQAGAQGEDAESNVSQS
jgi:hypothetical protein